MCGITGYIGENIAVKKIIEKLKILEYRGYDSAGIAVFDEGGIKITKSVGNISALEKKVDVIKGYSCGIGHTRWATHGNVSIKNSHPHISFDKKWVIVHNGIIENASKLKEDYLSDITPKSSTDTEIIAHLIAFEEGNSLEKIAKALKKMSGSWALAILNTEENDCIYLAKNKSPLYFASNEKEIFVASDPICFQGETKGYYSLKDGQIARLKLNDICVYDAFLNKKTLKKLVLKEKDDETQKKQYEHFMLKEIKDTKASLENLCQKYGDMSILEKIPKPYFDVDKVKIIGCGTAYNSGLIGASYLRKVLRVECTACIASEFRYSNPLIDEKTLCIFVSQSGETADTLECLKLAKKKRAKIIALTNVMYSSITKHAKIVLPICAGREIAVASTKAYTCQVAAFYLLSKWIESLSKNNIQIYKNAIKNIKRVAKMVEKFDIEQIKAIANTIKDENNVFFLGRKDDYFTALEGSLKLKEIAYINSNAYPSGELKHGFIALIEKNTPAIVFATDKSVFEKTLNCINEIASRGARVVLVSSIDVNKNEMKNISYLINIKNKGIVGNLYPLISVIFAQYLAYFTSIFKNNNPDKPRNLAKSVTVE